MAYSIAALQICCLIGCSYSDNNYEPKQKKVNPLRLDLMNSYRYTIKPNAFPMKKVYSMLTYIVENTLLNKPHNKAKFPCYANDRTVESAVRLFALLKNYFNILLELCVSAHLRGTQVSLSHIKSPFSIIFIVALCRSCTGKCFFTKQKAPASHSKRRGK